MVAPDSRVVGVSRQRPCEASPSEQALQSETGAFESTAVPPAAKRPFLIGVCLHDLGPRRPGVL